MAAVILKTKRIKSVTVSKFFPAFRLPLGSQVRLHKKNAYRCKAATTQGERTLVTNAPGKVRGPVWERG